jgi:hypothetical protein
MPKMSKYEIKVYACICMYLHVCACMPAIAERLRQAYPALPERAGVGSIPVVYVVPLPHILGKLQLIQLARQARAAPCST